MIFKTLVIWMLIAAAEILHGVLRVFLLNRSVGNHRARQIGVFTGSAIIHGKRQADATTRPA